MPETSINTGFRHFCPLFKLAKFGLILVVLIWLSILSRIDNSYLFYSLFFVLHIFSTNPVPLPYFHHCVQFWWIAGLFYTTTKWNYIILINIYKNTQALFSIQLQIFCNLLFFYNLHEFTVGLIFKILYMYAYSSIFTIIFKENGHTFI